MIEQLDLLHRWERVVALFRFSALLDRGTKLARVPSVESLLDRFGQSPIKRIVHDHRGPCDRLEHSHMPPDSQKQCRDYQPVAEAENCLSHTRCLAIPDDPSSSLLRSFPESVTGRAVAKHKLGWRGLCRRIRPSRCSMSAGGHGASRWCRATREHLSPPSRHRADRAGGERQRGGSNPLGRHEAFPGFPRRLSRSNKHPRGGGRTRRDSLCWRVV